MTVFLRPNLARCIWTTPFVAAILMSLVMGIRKATGYHPVWSNEPMLIAGYIGLTVGFLIGIGGFDYWWRWMTGAEEKPEDHSQHGAHSWKDYFKFNTDHKVIGVQYIVLTFVFFMIAGLFAMAFRTELAKPGLQALSGEQFNGLVSQHAILMILLFIIPVFAGMANYVIPLMLGAPDMAFPRLNAVSFWMLPVAGFMFLSAYLYGSFNTGWTAYPTIAGIEYSPNLGQTVFELGVQIAGASSIATAVNFMVTIITMRAPGMTLFRMPLLVWANLTTSALVVFATPFIAGSQFMTMFDRSMGTQFFVPSGGGSPTAYQHIFWFYSHPAVYIMMLPGFGIISEVIAVNARKPIFGYRAVAFSTVGIAVLGFIVWAHHMFVSGIADWIRIPIMLSTMLIAVPTGIKIFAWLGTMWSGVIRFNSAMLFAVGFIFTFVIGGLSGIMLASIPFDVNVSNGYFIVAHFHYVLFGGSVMTIYAGLYFWYPKMTGRLMNEKLGKWHFWLTFISMNLTFFPMHLLGLEGMPRRVSDYNPALENTNQFVTIASFFLGASTLIFVYNFVTSWKTGKVAGPNPWNSLTLEWQLSSPPPIFNFAETPRVVGGPYRYGEPGAKHAVFPSQPVVQQEPVHV